MKAFFMFLNVLSFNIAAGQVLPCGHVQELSRATLHPSNEIFIYTGSSFYLCDLESEQLSEKHLMSKYYKGAPTDMKAILLYKANETAMLITKGNTIYKFSYMKSAFIESEHVLDNMDKRKSLEKMTVEHLPFKNPETYGIAYNTETKMDEYRVTICIKEGIQHCRAELKRDKPLDDCQPYEQLTNYGTNCRGLTTAKFDGYLFLVLANEEELILLMMEEDGSIDPKPFKRLNLATLFSCSSSTLFIFVPLLVIFSVSVIILVVVITSVWAKRWKTKGVVTDEITVGTADRTVDRKTKRPSAKTAKSSIK